MIDTRQEGIYSQERVVWPMTPSQRNRRPQHQENFLKAKKIWGQNKLGYDIITTCTQSPPISLERAKKYRKKQARLAARKLKQNDS